MANTQDVYLLGSLCLCLLMPTGVDSAETAIAEATTEEAEDPVSYAASQAKKRKKAVRHGQGNEVLKTDQNGAEPDRTIKPDQLEAFYYGSWGDEPVPHRGFRAGRQGDVNKTDSCTYVRDVPHDLRHPTNFQPNGISNYYSKYTETYGIPVLGSSEVSDTAISRACYVLRFLLADRSDLRTEYFRAYGRVAVIPRDGAIRVIPEYHFLPAAYDEATPGLGAIPIAPVSSAKEDNVLCWRNDTFGREDILIREIGQGIFHLAARRLDPGLINHLGDLYDRAMASLWWRKTYAELTPASYFGEGLQSYFNVNAFANKANGEHNSVSTRTKLCAYDPALFQLIHKLWPCGNHYIKRCLSRGSEFFQKFNRDCPRGQGYSRIPYRK